MEIFEFVSKFSDEQNCKEFFRNIQMKEGVVYNKCARKKALLVDFKMAISVLEL